MPNDADEQSRLDYQHMIYRYALDDRLYVSPLLADGVKSILDVGCGTGRWCIDVAEQNPDALVVGFDLRQVRCMQ